MTPKEKSEELINKLLSVKCYNTRPIDLSDGQAKKCALIVVDELIEQCEDANFGGFGLYWQAVKQEIDNL